MSTGLEFHKKRKSKKKQTEVKRIRLGKQKAEKNKIQQQTSNKVYCSQNHACANPQRKIQIV